MLRPTRLTEAHGPITCTRHRRERSATRSATRVLSSVLAAGSSDTVTLVSEVDTRSTDMPCSLKIWKASARKPTWCHMPGLSSDTSVMPFLVHTAFTCAAARGALRSEHRALKLGRLGGVDVQRDAVLARRQDAARVQHLGAAGGDLLRLVVVQRAQQARGRRGARIGAEHARHVGPDLQPLRAELRREVGRGGVRAAAPEEHGVAVLVAGDEALGDDDRGEGVQLRGECRIGREIAHRREHARLGAARRALRAQHGARIGPRHLEPRRAQEARADLGCHQFPGRQHARARALAHLAHQRHPGGDLAQFREVPLDLLAHRDAELRGEPAMALLDGAQLLLLRLSDGGIQQPLEPVGDARRGPSAR